MQTVSWAPGWPIIAQKGRKLGIRDQRDESFNNREVPGNALARSLRYLMVSIVSHIRTLWKTPIGLRMDGLSTIWKRWRYLWPAGPSGMVEERKELVHGNRDCYQIERHLSYYPQTCHQSRGWSTANDLFSLAWVFNNRVKHGVERQPSTGVLGSSPTGMDFIVLKLGFYFLVVDNSRVAGLGSSHSAGILERVIQKAYSQRRGFSGVLFYLYIFWKIFSIFSHFGNTYCIELYSERGSFDVTKGRNMGMINLKVICNNPWKLKTLKKRPMGLHDPLDSSRWYIVIYGKWKNYRCAPTEPKINLDTT